MVWVFSLTFTRSQGKSTLLAERVFPHLPMSKLSRRPSLLHFQNQENQNQQIEEQLELRLAFMRIDKSPPTPVNNQTPLLAQRREHPPSKHLQ